MAPIPPPALTSRTDGHGHGHDQLWCRSEAAPPDQMTVRAAAPRWSRIDFGVSVLAEKSSVESGRDHVAVAG